MAGKGGYSIEALQAYDAHPDYTVDWQTGAVSMNPTSFTGGVPSYGADRYPDGSGSSVAVGSGAGTPNAWEGQENIPSATPIGGSDPFDWNNPDTWTEQQRQQFAQALTDRGYGNDPFSGGGNTGGGFSNTDRDYFGSPADYYQSSYVPGQDSPWGQPDQPGGNEDFYRQQFNNLLTEEQAFQNAELASAFRRQNSQDNRQDNLMSDPFSWTQLPERAVGVEQEWTSREGITPGMSNQAVFEVLRPTLEGETEEWFERMLMGSEDIQNSTNWSRAQGGPGAMIAADTTTDPSNMPYVQNFWNAYFRPTNQTVGPGTVPAGYAAPI